MYPLCASTILPRGHECSHFADQKTELQTGRDGQRRHLEVTLNPRHRIPGTPLTSMLIGLILRRRQSLGRGSHPSEASRALCRAQLACVGAQLLGEPPQVNRYTDRPDAAPGSARFLVSSTPDPQLPWSSRVNWRPALFSCVVLETVPIMSPLVADHPIQGIDCQNVRGENNPVTRFPECAVIAN